MISLEKAAEMLCHDPRTVQKYVTMGDLPELRTDGEGLFFDEQELLDHFGLEKLDEPFLTIQMAAEQMGIKVSSIQGALRDDYPMTSYRLSHMRGAKILVRASDIRDYFTLRFAMSTSQVNLRDKYRFMKSCIEKFLDSMEPGEGEPSRRMQIVRSLLIEEKSLEELAEQWERQPERVRQIFDSGKRTLLAAVRMMYNRSQEFKQVVAQQKDLADKLSILRKEYEQVVGENNEFRLRFNLEARTPLEMNESEYLSIRVEEMDLSVRAFNCLKAGNIHTLRGIVTTPVSEMQGMRNFGKKTLDELRLVVAKYGLKLIE